MVENYLLVYDTSGIKNYIFGTAKLKEIRGASAILDILNRVKSEKIIENICNNIEKIYTNGGTGQFILKYIDENKINLIEQELCNAYSKETINGVNLICGYSKLNQDKSNYQEALRECYFMINQKKNKKFSKLISGSLLSKNCESFTDSYSSLIVKTPDDNELEYLSEFSYNKRKTNSDRLWKEFIDNSFSNIDIKEAKRPKEFSDIDKDIALVYADGNAMGKLIKSFKQTEDYKTFADIVDSSIRKACYETLKEIYPNPDEVKADILLLGGDDLVVVIKASDSFDFAWKVAEKFNNLTKEELSRKANDVLKKTGNQGFTISVGVSIGNANYPFRILVDQAEELLKIAKQKGSANGATDYYAPAYIDFHVNKQSNQLDIKQFRENNYKFKSKDKEYKRSIRPFSLEDSKKFSRSIREIQKNPNIGRTRIHMLREAVNENTFSKIQLKFMHSYGRIKKKEELGEILKQFDCMINPPWNSKNETVITDISDMIDWIKGEANEA
ncbi:MAG: hypothetical protein U0354_15520 [Candidatus Sericytochromatia bacterium]